MSKVAQDLNKSHKCAVRGNNICEIIARNIFLVGSVVGTDRGVFGEINRSEVGVKTIMINDA